MDRYMLFPSGMGQHQNGSYVLFADAQATIAALQADNRTYINERHEHMKQIEQLQAELERTKFEMASELELQINAVVREREQLKAQLTQRTAELEAAQREARLQKEVEAALLSKVAEYEVELNGDPQNFYGRGRTVGLRTLVLALPKAEGKIVVNGRTIDEQYPTLSWQIASTGMDEFTNAIAAILKHRQEMEG